LCVKESLSPGDACYCIMSSFLFFVACVACCVISSSAVPADLSAARPNVIILFADDFGYGDVSCNVPGNNKTWTPNMDKLAASGIRFTDMHVGASVCTPSRAALLTGRLGIRTGVYQNFWTDALFGLPLEERTLAEYLLPAGYDTAMIGKWHLGTQGPYHPTSRGFQHYLGVPYSVDMGCTDVPGYNIPAEAPCPKDTAADTGITVALPMYKCLLQLL
jgi:arylsulfatase G